MKRKLVFALILAAMLLTIPVSGALMAYGALPSAAIGPAKSGAGIIPTFVITAVQQDEWVEIQTDNFPADDYFVVTMGPMGTKGVNGIVVATQYSDDGGRFKAKYPIPATLRGSAQISIRLESSETGYYAYNWFYNANANVPGTSKPSSGYSGYPYFYIYSVVEGKSVTITPYNFPPNDEFLVRMNWMGTLGVAGAVVQTVTTDAKGNLSDTKFSIPDFLAGAYQVAIRLESPDTGYYAYNWFYNNTYIPDGSNDGEDTNNQCANIPASYKGYPTFAITAVKRDKNVSILTWNLPPNDKFVVTMGPMGTLGIGGYYVAKFDSGAGGEQELKFKTPPELYGSYQISIRIESPCSGYYAYNWFYNNTYPGTDGGDGDGTIGYYGYPYFFISAVKKGTNVTIQPHNFPPNDEFLVRMNWMSTEGVAGAVVQTVTTDANGNLSDIKFPIPDFLTGAYQIAIRLESPTSGYYAYNWFFNTTAVVDP